VVHTADTITGDVGQATEIADGILPLVSGVTDAANGGLTGSVSADTGPDGMSPTIQADVIDPAATQALDQAAGTVANDLPGTQLSDGPLATASVLPNGSDAGDGGNVTINDPSQTGPLIEANAASDGQSDGSSNLIDAAAGPSSDGNVTANVLGGSSTGTDGAADGHIIDMGPGGQQLAEANVATAADQFQFTSLGGTGTDALTGATGSDLATPIADAVLPVAVEQPIDLGGDMAGLDVTGQPPPTSPILDIQQQNLLGA
jgi:hypothetical protein